MIYNKLDGYYLVCVSFVGSAYWSKFPNISVKVHIVSDNMDEPNLKDALKQKDANEFHSKLRNIINIGSNIVSGQKSEMKQEDLYALYAMDNTRTLYYLAFFQIFVIVCLGIYQIISFRKYLTSHHII